MGMYDLFRAACPHCEQMTNFQTKFLPDPMQRCFSVGELIPEAPEHKCSIELAGVCEECNRGHLFARLHGQRFQGFFEQDYRFPVFYSDQARRDEMAENIRRIARQMDRRAAEAEAEGIDVDGATDVVGPIGPNALDSLREEPPPSAYEGLADRIANAVMLRLNQLRGKT